MSFFFFPKPTKKRHHFALQTSKELKRNELDIFFFFLFFGFYLILMSSIAAISRVDHYKYYLTEV